MRDDEKEQPSEAEETQASEEDNGGASEDAQEPTVND